MTYARIRLIAELLTVGFGLCAELLDFGEALLFGLGDGRIHRLFSILLGLFHLAAAILTLLLGLFGRADFGLLDNLLCLCLGLLDFLYQFHLYPCYSKVRFKDMKWVEYNIVGGGSITILKFRRRTIRHLPDGNKMIETASGRPVQPATASVLKIPMSGINNHTVVAT
jgi:hypothetical protein